MGVALSNMKLNDRPHEVAIADFILNNPDYQRYGLFKTLDDLFSGYCDGEFVSSGLRNFGYTPDAFHIDPTSKILRLLEVDGHSYTDIKTIQKLIDLWWFLDDNGWSAHLTIWNLFTGSRNTFDDEWFANKALNGVAA